MVNNYTQYGFSRYEQKTRANGSKLMQSIIVEYKSETYFVCQNYYYCKLNKVERTCLAKFIFIIN